MITANYSSGRKYRAPSIAAIDFNELVTAKLLTLQVGAFSWVPGIHGQIIYHGRRVKKNTNGHTVWQVYIAVTIRWKIFVNENGLCQMEEDWIPGNEIYEKFQPSWAGEVMLARKKLALDCPRCRGEGNTIEGDSGFQLKICLDCYGSGLNLGSKREKAVQKVK